MESSGDVDVLEPITDEELTALALAADPDPLIDDDAVPLSAFHAEFGDILPDWYMPAPASISGTPGRRRRNAVIASVVIFSLLFINALGLCITYGRLEVPF
ncbi:MAG: hypothetical protein JWM34_2817 [Ilumatobacteraceae bacterium]|nr:hypothetical protein [Ilumatobacteraceae bacterium]